MKPDVTLKVFGVPQNNLKDFHVTPNKRTGIEHLPSDEFRLHDEEIKSAVEFERDSQKSKSSSTASSTKSGTEENKGGSDRDS